jgi:uncharacterized protein YndB with AHSA1/START domain
MNVEPTTSTEQALVITRVFNAPRELVWKAWTDPEMMKRWWGPKAYTAPVVKIDLRVGGTFLGSMRDAEGKDIWSTCTYLEIVPPERLVMTDSFADAEGNIVPSTVYGMEGIPLVMHITVELKDLNGKTEMTLTHTGLPAGEHSTGANIGWNESLDKLEAALH